MLNFLLMGLFSGLFTSMAAITALPFISLAAAWLAAAIASAALALV